MNSLHPDLSRILVSEATIQQHVAELAQQISADYAQVERLCLVGVLKGAFIFLADLARQLTIPHFVDFIAVSSYGKAGAVSGAVRLVMDLREPIEGEHVLIVEDIVDSGNTLHYLVETLNGRHPASLRTCALVRKQSSHPTFPVDYLGFEIPDVWVVGYGLDYADRHRTLPYIAELKPQEK
jgi:hypoxanthine phosphoribosyltransferase